VGDRWGSSGEVVDRRNHNTGQLTIDLSHKKNWLSGQEQRRRNQKYEQMNKNKKQQTKLAGF